MEVVGVGSTCPREADHNLGDIEYCMVHFRGNSDFLQLARSSRIVAGGPVVVRRTVVGSMVVGHYSTFGYHRSGLVAGMERKGQHLGELGRQGERP